MGERLSSRVDVSPYHPHPPVVVVAGIQIFPNRFMTAARVGKTGAIFPLNPNTVQYWVNANKDFKVSPFKNLLEVGQDAMVAMVENEIQFAVSNLLTNGCVST